MADTVVTPPPAPGTPPAPPAPPANAPWYGTPDAETLGYMQTRGFDKMTPDKAALEAMKAHREAEKLVGVPKEQLLRIPAKEDTKAWGDLWQRLGRPAEAKEYDFSLFKDPQGQPLLAEEEANILRDLAYSLNLSKDGATLLVQKLAGISAEEAKHQAAAVAGEYARQLDTLKNNWAHNANSNRVVADNAAKALGLDPSVLDTKGAPVTIPYAQAQELFRSIGVRMGEDKFVNSGSGSPAGAMSKDEAQYKLDLLGRDAVWFKKFQDGDVVARKEFDDLTRVLHAG